MAFAGAPRISDFERAAEKVLRADRAGELETLSRALTRVACEEARYASQDVDVKVELYVGKVPARLPGFFAEARGQLRKCGNQYEIHAAVPRECMLLGRMRTEDAACRAPVLASLAHEFTHLKQALAGSLFRPARVRGEEREHVSYYASSHEIQAHAAIASAPDLFGDEADNVLAQYRQVFKAGTGRDKKNLFKFKRQMGRFAQQRQDDEVYYISDLLDGRIPGSQAAWPQEKPAPNVLRRAQRIVTRDLYVDLRVETMQKRRKR